MAPRRRAPVALVTIAFALVTSGCTAVTAPPSPSVPRSQTASEALPSSTVSATQATQATPGQGCPSGAGTTVRSAAQLQHALADATAGSLIELAPATYVGHFVAHGAGTQANPITLCGPRSAILDGGSIVSGYVLHLDHAQWWHVVGFTVQDGQKGVVLDKSDHNQVSDLRVTHIGDEGIHLRDFSDDNVVDGNVVSGTGNLRTKFGEGIYVGTAHKNWCSITACQVDASDRNVIRNNIISMTTAENIDIKEGTSSGVIEGNQLSGVGMVSSAAKAWVNVKGNHWTISHNHGVDSIKDGFQVHQVYPGWGLDNVFTDNTADVGAAGWGYYVQRKSLDAVIGCSNTATGAGAGVANVSCATGF